MTGLTRALRIRISQGTPPSGSSRALHAFTSSLALGFSNATVKRYYSATQPRLSPMLATSRNAQAKLSIIRGSRSASFLNGINGDLPVVGGGQPLGEDGRYVLDRKLISDQTSETWLAMDSKYAIFCNGYHHSSTRIRLNNINS